MAGLSDLGVQSEQTQYKPVEGMPTPEKKSAEKAGAAMINSGEMVDKSFESHDPTRSFSPDSTPKPSISGPAPSTPAKPAGGVSGGV